MTERPIIFSAPMVRAILDGKKTQTRRIVRTRDLSAAPGPSPACPYGGPGDRLWVREAFAGVQAGPNGEARWVEVTYRADNGGRVGRWRSPIHMPRQLSRITLAIAAVRSEDLHAITEDDARREGVSTRDAYARGWDSIHGPGAWSLNPLVWVVDFATEVRP